MSDLTALADEAEREGANGDHALSTQHLFRRLSAALRAVDQAPEPVAWRWRDPVDNTVGEWRSMPVVPIKIEPGETEFEYDYSYLSPPNLAAELAEERSHNGAMQMFMLVKNREAEDARAYTTYALEEQRRYHAAELAEANENASKIAVEAIHAAALLKAKEAELAEVKKALAQAEQRVNELTTHLTADTEESEALRARQAVLVEALTELVAAGDNSVSATDDVAAMLRFGSAVDAARAALAQIDEPC